MSGLLGSLPGEVWYLGYTGLIDSNGSNRIATGLSASRAQNCQNVHLALNSSGGTVNDGMYLYNLIRAMQLDLRAHNLGCVLSIALIPFLAADRRTCSLNATFMMHPTSFAGSLHSATHIRGLASTALLDEQRIETILRDRTRLPRKLLNARRTRELQFSAKDALKYGFVDEIGELTIPQGTKYVQL